MKCAFLRLSSTFFHTNSPYTPGSTNIFLSFKRSIWEVHSSLATSSIDTETNFSSIFSSFAKNCYTLTAISYLAVSSRPGIIVISICGIKLPPILFVAFSFLLHRDFRSIREPISCGLPNVRFCLYKCVSLPKQGERRCKFLH